MHLEEPVGIAALQAGQIIISPLSTNPSVFFGRKSVINTAKTPKRAPRTPQVI